MTNNATWTPVAILPNISARKPLDGEVIALVPRSDPRIEALSAAHPKLASLLSRFTDAFQVALDPVVLIVRDDVIPQLTVDALASFRDLVVVSVVPYCRALATMNGNPHHIFYSDWFALYPWMLGTDNDHLVARTAAMTALHVVDEFHGQSSPEIPPMQLHELDKPLFEVLVKRWKRRYLAKRPRWSDHALFRSLNMANQAAQVPANREPVLYDLGRIVALWVSAFEILAHPKRGVSGLPSVYPLLEKVNYQDRRVARCSYLAFVGRKNIPRPRRCRPCWLYGRLYQARCAFLHGGPIRISLLIPKNSKEGLFWLAPLLYRLALTGFLDLSLNRPMPPFSRPAKLGMHIAEDMKFTKYQQMIERALMRRRQH